MATESLPESSADEEPLGPGHTLDDFGEHNPGECYECLLAEEVKCICDCAKCCRHMFIEVLAEDAKREPKIAEKGSPILDDPDENGHREVIGYMLNSRGEDMACVFLDRETNRCTIHETRPLLCRLFDCDGAGREHLVEIGVFDQETASP